MRPQAGFTLWELLCTMVVATVLLGLGVPSFERFALDARLTADVNGFVTAIQLARSEAAKRGHNVVLCKTTDRRSCADAEAGYEAGWMVFVNEDDVLPPARSDSEPLLFAYSPTVDGTIRSNRRLYHFRPFLVRSTNGTITFCDRRGERAAKAVIVSYTGRPRTSSRGPGNRALICA